MCVSGSCSFWSGLRLLKMVLNITRYRALRRNYRRVWNYRALGEKAQAMGLLTELELMYHRLSDAGKEQPSWPLYKCVLTLGTVHWSCLTTVQYLLQCRKSEQLLPPLPLKLLITRSFCTYSAEKVAGCSTGQEEHRTLQLWVPGEPWKLWRSLWESSTLEVVLGLSALHLLLGSLTCVLYHLRGSVVSLWLEAIYLHRLNLASWIYKGSNPYIHETFIWTIPASAAFHPGLQCWWQHWYVPVTAATSIASLGKAF